MTAKIDAGQVQTLTHEASLPSAETSVVTVRLGERSLTDVAHRVGVGQAQLLQANPQISDPLALSAGQEIRLPEKTVEVLASEDARLEGSFSTGPGTHPLAFGDPLAKTGAEWKLAENSFVSSCNTEAVRALPDPDRDAGSLLSQFRNVSGMLKHLLHSHPVHWDQVRSAFSEVSELERKLGRLGISVSADPASMPSADSGDDGQNVQSSVNLLRQDVQSIYQEFAKLDPVFGQENAPKPASD